MHCYMTSMEAIDVSLKYAKTATRNTAAVKPCVNILVPQLA